MSLPALMEVQPWTAPVRAQVTVPGSKSVTNRALVLAALASGETVLEGALWSEDTQVMVECLQELGFMVNVQADPLEEGNRTITVYGLGGQVPRGGTAGQPLELFVGNAGTAARFLAALVCLGQGVYRLHGVPRMHERPQAALFQALRQLGYRVEGAQDRLPAQIHGGGPRRGDCVVSLAESSQFASALLLAAEVGGWTVRLEGENAEASSYVQMTRRLRAVFPHGGGTFRIEPDASSGSHFWGAERLQESRFGVAGWIAVAHWPDSGWQVDARFPNYWPLPPQVSRQTDLADSILTAMVLAPLADDPVTFTDLGRLRLQECERVAAMRTELAQCGAQVREQGDTLEIRPSELHGAEIETYGDHRVAMAFAILGLHVNGLRLKNPACVKKTFPNFFQKLAAPPPVGLGIRFWDVTASARGRKEMSLAQLAASP